MTLVWGRLRVVEVSVSCKQFVITIVCSCDFTFFCCSSSRLEIPEPFFSCSRLLKRFSILGCQFVTNNLSKMTISDGPPAPPLTIHCLENDYLNIQIDGQDQFPMNILVHKNFSMKKLMYRYSRKIGLPISLLRFRFDGKAILFTDTPSTLGLVEGDVIDVFYPLTGGS